ncbi:MAG: 50S ribosomal protein L22 [Patescibacteria group bacterium]|nr:50S ribosomal protein L22 [bacterium]MDZ4240799.1 50S ribosomal protein L22 [Patescibacteria group bacterium]
MATAILRNLRQSPRKVRLLADVVRGKKVPAALIILKHATKRSASPLLKLLESAVANAKMQNLSPESLIVKEITVNGGAIAYRQMPRARGTAYRIRKRTSHISMTLEEPVTKNKKKTAKESQEKK